jgi:hypothetical protein
MYEVTLGIYCVIVIWSPEERVPGCSSVPVWTGSASDVSSLTCTVMVSVLATHPVNCTVPHHSQPVCLLNQHTATPHTLPQQCHEWVLVVHAL